MNKSVNAIEAQVEQAIQETVNGDVKNGSGLVLPPFNAESAAVVLEWLRQGLPQEQETFERLTQALSETHAATANGSTTAIEAPAAAPTSNGAGGRSPSFILPPNYPEGAIAFLRELREGDAEEQRETFEYLKKALNEERAAGGERLLFSDDPTALPESESQPIQPNAYGAPLPPFDPERAIAFLESLYEGDAEEQFETFEYLKRALNETRAANGERLLFLDE